MEFYVCWSWRLRNMSFVCCLYDAKNACCELNSIKRIKLSSFFLFPLNVFRFNKKTISCFKTLKHAYPNTYSQQVAFIIFTLVLHPSFWTFLLKVSEMKAEYFPPKEDVILQNEAPTDFYLLVTGAVVRTF